MRIGDGQTSSSERRGLIAGARDVARRATAWRVLACASLLYAATSGGDLVGDSEVRWASATQLVRTGSTALVPGTTGLYAHGIDGRQYSYYGPASTLMLAPMVLAGDALAATGAIAPQQASQAGQLLAALLLFPLIGALAVTMLYLCARELGADNAQGIWLAVIFGAGTLHWQYSINTYEESQIALCALTALWAALKARSPGGLGWPIAAVGASAVAAAFRLSSVAITAPLLLCLAASDIAARPGRRLRRVLSWALAAAITLAPTALALGWFNQARFGSWTETGYSRAHVTADLGLPLAGESAAAALAGMWLSPGKSLILFSPVLAAGLVGLALMWRRRPSVAAGVTLALAGTSALHASLSWWAGDLAWGCRYLASSVGLLVLPVLWLLGRRRRWLLLVIVPSVAVQLASVVYSFSLEFYQDRRHGLLPDAYVWRWDESQLVQRFHNIGLHLAGKPDYSSKEPDSPQPTLHQAAVSERSVRRMHAVNFYPFKAAAAGADVGIVRVLTGVWAAMLAALAAIVVHWIWRTRKVPKPD